VTTFGAQNATEYEIWLHQTDGRRLTLIEPLAFEYVIPLNDIGRWTITLPADFDPAFIRKDRRISIWRAPAGGALRRECSGLLTWWQYADTEAGMKTLRMAGPLMTALLKRRIVAYAAGSAEAEKTNQADDLMKAIVRENLGSLAAAARQDSWLTVEQDWTLGPSLSKGFSRRNVLAVLQDIADTARQNGTEIYFDLAPINDRDLVFRTYRDQPGRDRSAWLSVSIETGNLSKPSLTIDYDNEINFAYAGGQGEGALRTIETAEDTARSGLSAFARSEGFADARNDSSSAGVQATADALLTAGRPIIKFTGDLIDQPGTCYGGDWFHGDRLTANYRGLQFACLVRSLHVSVKPGVEVVEAKLEGTL
jgi:hypothetical protein